jgi:hypothetical protein
MPINMLPQILKYFRAEKEASTYILLIAAAIVLLSVWIWWRGSRYRAIAIPLTLLAVVELAAGATIYLRTDRQIDTLTEQYYSDREAYGREESARMERVVTSFRFYKIAEIVVLIAGLSMIAVYRARPALLAVGAGLVVQATILLIFDMIAAQRAQVYLDALRRM